MSTKTKTKPPADQADDDDKGTDDDTGTDDDKGTDDDALVEAVAARVLELLDAVPGTGDGGGAGDGAAAGGPPRSTASVENDMAAAVRRAMDELKKEEAAEGRIKQLEHKVEEKIKETAPRAVRRLTKIMWGADDK